MKTIELSPLGLKNCGQIVAQLRAAAVGERELTLDLKNWTFVRPPLLALFAAHVRLLATGTNPVEMRIVLPRVHNVRTYLEQMNFEGALVRGTGGLLDRSEAQFLPICPLTTGDDTENAALRLKQIVLSKMDAADELKASIGSTLAITLAELMENFRRHAETTNVAFACAQFYPAHEYRDSTRQQPRFRPGAIEIAIADTGIGIEASLSAEPKYALLIRGGCNPCELATRFGVTSKEGQGHQGYGLWLTRRLAERDVGTFVLLSGGWLFKVVRGRGPSRIA